jgi:high-affinity iron transporter
MLLTSVILVLQELLEASLVISVLLAFSFHNGLSKSWAWAGMVLGIAGAVFYASQVNLISAWFDYVGLEVTNAAIQFCLCIFLFIFCFVKASVGKNVVLAKVLMSMIVALALTREGFEILLYESGFSHNREQWSAVLVGSALGAGIGISIGTLLYYGLISFSKAFGNTLLTLLLALFTGNMAAQGTLLLIQADWLSGGSPLWNTNGVIAESSLLGKLLYALIGYEASPSGMQVLAYISTFILIVIVSTWRSKSFTASIENIKQSK